MSSLIKQILENIKNRRLDESIKSQPLNFEHSKPGEKYKITPHKKNGDFDKGHIHILDKTDKLGGPWKDKSGPFLKIRHTGSDYDDDHTEWYHHSEITGIHGHKENLNPNESIELDEGIMRDIKDHPVGTTIHPLSSGHQHYMSPLTITRKLASKTELTRDSDGTRYHVSHATGKVTDHKGNKSYGYGNGFHLAAEKKVVDDRKRAQSEKDDAHSSITKHLDGMKNGYGNTVGKLSDEEHQTILQHLEKLRK